MQLIATLPVCLSFNRMKWLACMLLGCYAAVAQLHRDPTLDRHWDLWKETYGKHYREKVGGSSRGRFAFILVPYTFPLSNYILVSSVFSKC